MSDTAETPEIGDTLIDDKGVHWQVCEAPAGCGTVGCLAIGCHTWIDYKWRKAAGLSITLVKRKSTSAGYLPSDSADRKSIPIYSGLIRYFPLALCEVAKLSKKGNDQHNPGEPLHWARDKSKDHHDCIGRHLIDVGTIDTDGERHSAKVAWRALAALELELEAAREAESK